MLTDLDCLRLGVKYIVEASIATRSYVALYSMIS